MQRGRFERTITLAHQVEAMARQKTLLPLGEYLKPMKKKKRRAGDGSEEVAALLDRKIAKQDRAAAGEGSTKA